jgi:hypothetical protein
MVVASCLPHASRVQRSPDEILELDLFWTDYRRNGLVELVSAVDSGCNLEDRATSNGTSLGASTELSDASDF